MGLIDLTSVGCLLDGMSETALRSDNRRICARWLSTEERIFGQAVKERCLLDDLEDGGLDWRSGRLGERIEVES